MSFNQLNLQDKKGYENWRDTKYRAYEDGRNTSVVNVAEDLGDHSCVSSILSACEQFNYCIYRLEEVSNSSKPFVSALGQSLGLNRLDGNLCSDEDNISAIQVMETGRHTGYIPYTDKPLTWHTDGYYNDKAKTIRAMVLHCVRPAQEGGENLMLDHEMAYIQLREAEPRFIESFMQADVLTIPPNIEKGKEIRGEVSGPVFTMDDSGYLHMRYSARTRNIQWKDDGLTQEAVACMCELLGANNPYVITYRMQAGEGIIANNVLHNRTRFTDAEEAEHKRLLYRARYYDRVNRAETE